MKKMLVLGVVLATQGCAFPNSVQRMGADYNSAVASLANELTLLNIIRAKEGLPLHYTSFGRLAGTMTVKGTIGLNSAIRADQTTHTDQVATTESAAPSTVTTVIDQIQEGVDAVTPNIGADINTGPTFDIAVWDSQKFYQGILAAIPFPTVENFIMQGHDDQLLMRLLIERIDFRPIAANGDVGEVEFSWRNVLPGESGSAERDSRNFEAAIACYRLAGRSHRPDPQSLIPVSRLRRSDAGNLSGLTIQEIALLDSVSLKLTDPISANPGDDAKSIIQRVFPERRVADLVLLPRCKDETTGKFKLDPKQLPQDPVYLGGDRALVLAESGNREQEKRIRPEIIFRSTESVIRYIGRYLAAAEAGRAGLPMPDGKPLFSVVKGRPSNSLISTSVVGRRYSIANDERRSRNMMIIALIQQLVNLHKDASERPVTVPVQVIGGG